MHKNRQKKKRQKEKTITSCTPTFPSCTQSPFQNATLVVVAERKGFSFGTHRLHSCLQGFDYLCSHFKAFLKVAFIFAYLISIPIIFLLFVSVRWCLYLINFNWLFVSRSPISKISAVLLCFVFSISRILFGACFWNPFVLLYGVFGLEI